MTLVLKHLSQLIYNREEWETSLTLKRYTYTLTHTLTHLHTHSYTHTQNMWQSFL